jgi:uncharacterized protein YggU (UPF0235/DUF167 family)
VEPGARTHHRVARLRGQTGWVRIEIHVRPGASATAVGGEFDGALVVRVVERPDRGRATDAALGALADALSLPRRSVRLVRGATSRRKVVDLDVAEEAVDAVLGRLLNGPAAP